MPPDALLTFDTHLAECDRCFENTADLRSQQQIAASLPDALLADAEIDEHLSYEQFAAYVDGKMGEIDKEIVDVHKRVCSECRVHLDELLQLRATLELDTRPVTTPVSVSGRRSLSNLWNGITAGSFVKFAAPAFAVLLIGVVIWAAWFLTRTPLADVAEVVPPSANKPTLESNTENGNVDLAVNGETNSNSTTPQLAISLADGGTRIEIDDDGNVTGLNEPQFESRVKAALTSQIIEISPAARELRSKSGVLMGGGQTGVPFALTTPVGKIIQSDRPQFRWRPLKDAESYVVTIFDANFNKVTASLALRQPVWTVGTRLKRGVVYGWQVTAVKDGQEIRSPVRPAPDARFKIVDAQAANDIDAAKRNHGSSHLLLGILYANAGMIDEAEREFRALVRQNPKSDVARRLLQKVRAAR